MSEALIEQTTARVFADHVDASLLARFERGEWPRDLWRLVEDAGLSLALAADGVGGIGASWSDVYPILRGLGYWRAPLPLAETMIAAWALSQAGIDIPAGPIALIDEDAASALRIAENRLHGGAPNVQWAQHCPAALVSVGSDIALVDLGQREAVRIGPGLNAAGEPDDEVAFAGARIVARAAAPWRTMQLLRTLAALARSAMMVGVMESLLEQSVQYARDRVQFGRPIGHNQAIQHALAQMAGDVVAARTAAIVACIEASAEDRSTLFFSVAAAKIRAGEAAARTAAIAHQVHGAIGFTREHTLHFGTRRLWAWREAAGSEAWWAQRLGAAAIAARAPGFWRGITNRTFESPDAPATRSLAPLVASGMAR